MKAIKTSMYMFLAGLFMLTSCQSTTAAAPDLGVRPDTMLSNEQIEQKLADFRAVKAVDVSVPSNVIAAKFKSQFATAYDVEWDMANSVYEVEFEISKVDYKAWYDADGNLLKYKQDISVRQLPEVVKNSVKHKYPKFRMDDAEKIFKGTDVLYEVSVEKGKQEFKTYFKEDGTFVKERAE